MRIILRMITDQVYHDHAGAGDDKHTNIGWTKLVKD